MYCQLDQVGEILNIAGAVKDAVAKDAAGVFDVATLSFKASSVIFGLLLLNDNDVFIKKGTVSIKGIQANYYWVELYLDGLPFILTVINEAAPEVLFLPEEEAEEEYGFLPEQDHEWRPSDCEEEIWRAVLATLDVNKPVQQILGEILKII
ncbi:hypothetical protein SAMN05660649_02438 [Desulfotomaculum arcticum]|uniref:Uncharacterized protein n=1 Tax=Desulfotruncus arcticus DSM 17038 TaxID=1121424 RepID=A0A1I2U0W9_9FIRM|nr:hypothetical protein [Desulfotruncus arcticus]SFG70643.1 hypothetical protein SAMN05660649_02438 [Desulfotomaculum arcticum] [Desulfotruncus arcticus DSM 17038]